MSLARINPRRHMLFDRRGRRWKLIGSSKSPGGPPALPDLYLCRPDPIEDEDDRKYDQWFFDDGRWANCGARSDLDLVEIKCRL